MLAVVATVSANGLVVTSLHAQPPGTVRIVSLPDWSLIAWKSGNDICFSWHGEPDRIETVSGCRPRPRAGLLLLVGETGNTTRFAGIATAAVAYVGTTANKHLFSVTATKPLPAVIGEGLRSYFIRFQPTMPPSVLATVHWTLIAFDKHHRRIARLQV